MTRGATTPADYARRGESRSDFRALRPEIQPLRPSLRAAVDEMCRYCITHPGGGGGWRQQVARCTSCDCPLWPVRPRPERRRGA